MYIVAIKKIEGCIEGTNVKDLLFDEPISKLFAEYLGRLGKYIYNDNFDKPFFKIIVRSYYTLKGSIGNRSIRIILPSSIDEDILRNLINYVNEFE